MAREQISPNPSQRLLEVYTDFSGGNNSEISNEKLKDSEFPTFDNVDLSGRGSARRRYGRVPFTYNPPTGLGQGMFFYFKAGVTNPYVIIAVGGYLYQAGLHDIIWSDISDYTWNDARLQNINLTIDWTGVLNPVAAFTWNDFPQVNGAILIPITGLPNGFQTTLPVEAVQYKGILYIATGTQLVQYDGTTASTVTPYNPTPLEAIYIGTNALMSNPSVYLTNGSQASGISAIGLQPSTAQAVSNQAITFTGYYNKASAITSVQYQFQYKKSSDSTWTLAQDWSTTSSFSFTPNNPVPYDIMLTVRDANNTATVSLPYIITQFPVVNQAPPATLPSSAIQSCTKIMLYWDRLILSKDNTNSYQIYVSDIGNPAYFPTTNTLSFDNGRAEPITAIVKFRSYLFIFTKTSIFSMQGKDPKTFTTNLIHDVYGCIADRSVQVIRNQIVFLSNEGIMELTPNMFFTSFDVKRIDLPIRSSVPIDTGACSVVYDNMYWICFPGSSIVYRMYHDLGGVWVRDTSSKLNIGQFLKYGGNIYNLTTDGKVWQHSKAVFDDCGEVYTMTVESKFHDFASHMNYKKLKRIFVLAKHYTHSVDIGVKVQADGAIVLTPDVGAASVDVYGNTNWTVTTTPNMHFYNGTALGNWLLGSTPLGNAQLSVQRATISGKGRRMKVIFTHSESSSCEIYGYGVEFRLKRP